MEIQELTVKPEAASSKLLNTIHTWTDSCGSLYNIEHELVKERDCAILKVGFFDELECRKFINLNTIELPGNFTIDNISCNMKKSSILIKLIKLVHGKKHHAENAIFSTLNVDDNEKMKVRIIYEIKESDIDSVYTAINKMKSSAIHHKDVSLLKITTRPKQYSLYFQVSTDTVHQRLVDVAAQHDGVIDFENKQIHIQICKSVSELE
jgi:hypothetical protein